MLKNITLLTIILAATAQTTAFGMRFKRLAKYSKFAFAGLAVRGTALKFEKDACEEGELPKKYGKLTIDEAAHKLYDKTMTNDELRELCVGLLQDRINHWYELLESATTEDERKQVPIYIRRHQDPRITADEMIDKCELRSDLVLRNLLGTTRVTVQLDDQGLIAAAVASITINKIHGFYNMISQMQAILHELVHVEQLQNIWLIKPMCLEKIPIDLRTGKPVVFFSHHWAQKFAENGDFEAESNDKLCEIEADTIPCMTNFNPLLFQNLPSNFDYNSEILEKGYLSAKEGIVIAAEYAKKYYEKYPHRRARDEQQLEYWKKHFPIR